MAVRSLAMLLASAAMAVSRVAAYAVVDRDALTDLGVAASMAAPAANTANTLSASAGMDGCVHIQIVHSTNIQHFDKRAVQLSLTNRSDVAYYAKLNFGTPAQAQYVQLDTGSFELWINPTCAGLSTSDAAFCQAVGRFDTAASSTLHALNTGKTLRYGIGSANISYATDDIALPGTGAVLSQVQFGIATSSVDEFSGILGIGYGLNLTTRYPNFVDALFDQGVTRVKAFSLALGSKAEQEGVVVFGGVDTSKFAGSLARLPITPAAFSPDGVPRYWVNMTSMSLTTSSASAPSTTSTYTNSSLQVFLDSGSTLTLLPADLVSAIAADFNAVGPSSSGFYSVDCSLADADGTLNFAFAGVTIAVAFRELIRQSGAQCMLGLQASSSFALLGDTFMRSAYVVIDQADNVVWMAPYTNCGSTPAALASAASLATITGACSQTGNADTSSSSSSDSSSSAPSAAAASSAASAAAASAKSTATATTKAAAPGTSSASTSSAAPRARTGLTLTLTLATLASSLLYATVYCF